MRVVPVSATFHDVIRRLIAKFRKKAYRHSYVRSHTKQFLARQMRAFRGKRSQKEFADVLGMSQSVVSERLENPNYGKWNLATLFDIAERLDVAVFVRFVDFGTFLELSSDLSKGAMRPQGYTQKKYDKLLVEHKDFLSLDQRDTAETTPILPAPRNGSDNVETGRVKSVAA